MAASLLFAFSEEEGVFVGLLLALSVFLEVEVLRAFSPALLDLRSVFTALLPDCGVLEAAAAVVLLLLLVEGGAAAAAESDPSETMAVIGAGGT